MNPEQLAALVEKFRRQNQFNPCINKDVILRRIGTKIVRAGDRLGRMPAPQTMFFAYCGERVYYKYPAKQWVN